MTLNEAVEEENLLIDTTDEFVTPAESFGSSWSGSSSDISSEDEPAERPVNPAPRSRRLRRGRNYLTYDRMGEPKISRYTMMAIEQRPR